MFLRLATVLTAHAAHVSCLTSARLSASRVPQTYVCTHCSQFPGPSGPSIYTLRAALDTSFTWPPWSPRTKTVIAQSRARGRGPTVGFGMTTRVPEECTASIQLRDLFTMSISRARSSSPSHLSICSQPIRTCTSICVPLTLLISTGT